jgi:WD40 repeat protein
MWKDNSSKETSFELEGSINGGSFALLQQLPANATTTSVSGRYSIGDSLSFRIRAVSDSIRSKYSNTAGVSIVFPAPSNLVLHSLTDADVQLSWQDNASFGDVFVVEHSTDGVAYSTLAIVGRDSTSATISDTFAIDATHYFRVKARSKVNTSGVSNVVSSTLHLNAPSGLSVSSVNEDTLIVRWTDNSTYEKGFAVERQVSGDPWEENGRVGANTTSWVDPSVDVAHSYSYRIRAFTGLGYSPYSSTCSARFDYDNTPVLIIRPKDSFGYTTVSALAIPPDGQSVICAVGRAVNQYNITTGALIRSFGSFSTDLMGGMAMSRDGSTVVACGSNDSTVVAWRVSDGSQIMHRGHLSQTVYSIDVNSDASFYAIPAGVGLVLVCSTKDSLLDRSIAPPTNTNCVAFNNTGDLLAVESIIGNSALLYRVSDGSLVRTFSGHTKGILSLAFNQSGTVLATGSMDMSVKLWDVNGSLQRTLTVDDNFVEGVSFDPAGVFVAAGGLNKAVKIWRVSDGMLIRALTGYTSTVTSTRFSPDGRLFLTGGYNGRIQIYKAYAEWLGY